MNQPPKTCNECGAPALYMEMGWDEEDYGGQPDTYWCGMHRHWRPSANLINPPSLFKTYYRLLREWWTNRCTICQKQIKDKLDRRDGSNMCWCHEDDDPIA